MRQAYDYWQDQPDNCSLRRSSTSAKALEDCCPPGPRSSIGVDRRQSVKTLSTTRSRRHWTIFQSVNVNSDSVVSCSHTESGTNLPKLDRDFSLRSQHLRPPELLSSPVKLSLSDPAPHKFRLGRELQSHGEWNQPSETRQRLQFTIPTLETT